MHLESLPPPSFPSKLLSFGIFSEVEGYLERKYSRLDIVHTKYYWFA
jgi:hypothetical protein